MCVCALGVLCVCVCVYAVPSHKFRELQFTSQRQFAVLSHFKHTVVTCTTYSIYSLNHFYRTKSRFHSIVLTRWKSFFPICNLVSLQSLARSLARARTQRIPTLKLLRTLQQTSIPLQTTVNRSKLEYLTSIHTINWRANKKTVFYLWKRAILNLKRDSIFFFFIFHFICYAHRRHLLFSVCLHG